MENARVSLDWQRVKQNGDSLWLLKNMGARLHLKGSHSNKMEATHTKQRRAYFNKVDSTKEFNPLRNEMRIPLEKDIVRRKKPEEQELEQKLSHLDVNFASVWGNEDAIRQKWTVELSCKK